MRRLFTSISTLALLVGVLPAVAQQAGGPIKAGKPLNVPGAPPAGTARDGSNVPRNANTTTNRPVNVRQAAEDVVRALGALGGGAAGTSERDGFNGGRNADTGPPVEAAEQVVRAIEALGGGAAGESVREGNNSGRYENTKTTPPRK